MEIAEFLLARIAEDGAVAQAVSDQAWLYHGVGTRGLDAEVAEAKLRHSDRWMPFRVLAECEAKRRIVEMVVAADDPVGTFDPDYWAGLGVAEAALQLLALPYANHPDYREEWRP